jgi:CheY-like chemotaxis protein
MFIYSSWKSVEPQPIMPNVTGAKSKPTVLLADDHAQISEAVADLLAEDYEVVASVRDGRQALELSRRLDPDVTILDVRMPELDGFETLRELRRMGSRAKVVFLTLHQSDAYVGEAIRSGAQGYVWKTRIHSDVKSAIRHALSGRLFVPSLTSLGDVVRNEHTVHFHRNDSYGLDEVSEFVRAVIRSGDPVVVVATDQTRTGIASRLEKHRLDLTALAQRGLYVELDAAESLSQIMRNGRPDRECVAGVAANLERMRLSAAPNMKSRLTIFGEMANLLLRDGNPDAIAELERIWNDETKSLPFFTVCSYSMECFKGEASRTFPDVCDEHSAVSHT